MKSAYRPPATPCWRRGAYSLSQLRPRFKPSRRTAHILAKYLTDRVRNPRKDTLSLQNVLNTIKAVWISPNSHFKRSSFNMEEYKRKKRSTVHQMPSPMLLRRRFSAPETIMRKHMLSQQQSESQDSDTTQMSDAKSCQCRLETGNGSDSNLYRKRDNNVMRRSTLMRRLWGGSKPLSERGYRFSSLYNDWQYETLSKGRSIQSLCSAYSSPEHLRHKNSSIFAEDKTSPVHKRSENLSGENKYNATVNKINNNVSYDVLVKPRVSVVNGNYDYKDSLPKTSCCNNYTYSTCVQTSSTSKESKLSTPKTPTTATTETESELYSTRSTSTTDTTTFSDHLDSAYTNSHSSFSQRSNETTGTNTENTTNSLEVVEKTKQTDNISTINATRHNDTDNSKPQSVTARSDFSTQTSDNANLNVISNVKLSQATLNIIFDKVMQDFQKSPSTNINISTLSTNLPLQSNINNTNKQPKLVQVQQAPSFYLKRKMEGIQDRPVLFNQMVSSVGAGSPYATPSETLQVVVPRYSALPRTTSMEVNTSSGESIDKDSDNISLVDSLEDPSSPRVNLQENSKYDNKPVRGELSPLLPDNSSTRLSKSNAKASVFFIPIESNIEPDSKSVAELLPEKVKQRLSKREIKRQEKLKQAKILSPRSDSNYVSASDNGTLKFDNIKGASSGVKSPFTNAKAIKNKRKNKLILPSIDPGKQSKSNLKANLEIEKTKPAKSYNFPKKKVSLQNPDSQSEASLNGNKQSHWMSSTRQKVLRRSNSLGETNSESGILPKRIYQKSEIDCLNKRIEILGIVECVETSFEKAKQQHGLSKSRNKSKIPIPVQTTLPNISKNDNNQKPVFLDFYQKHEAEPKIDQLIANILIDALNKNDAPSKTENREKSKASSALVTEKRPPLPQSSPMRHPSNKYQQMFEAIPEERTTSPQSSDDMSKPTALGQLSKNKHIVQNNSDKEGSSFSSKHSNHTTSHKPVVENGYKGKAALGVTKDDNYSTIPKGWITFYTLHKSEESPESTSDEGKKKANIDGNEEQENHKYKNISQSEVKVIQVKSANQNADDSAASRNLLINTKSRNNSSNDTWTSSDQEKYLSAHRNHQKKAKCKTNDPSPNKKFDQGNNWTVTVSGSTSGGQSVPDLEMRLTFPRYNKQSTLDISSNLSENNNKEKSEGFPYLNVSKGNKQVSRSAVGDGVSCVQQLPEIKRINSANRSQQQQTIQLVNTKNCGEPKQTRTSTRRFLLNRPKTYMDPDFIDLDTEYCTIKRILEKFPEILNIRGNAISPERKPRVPTMSERDIARYRFKHT